VRRQSLRRIQIGHDSHKVFEIGINTSPKCERRARIGLVEAIAQDSEDLTPGTIPQMREESLQSALGAEVRDLPFQDNRQSHLTFNQLTLVDSKDHSPEYGTDALHLIKSCLGMGRRQ
jgi:hypothetical protein